MAKKINLYKIWLAFYERVVKEQQEIVDEVKREEMLQISDDIDYYNEKLGLSDEIKHLLSEHRPSTVCLEYELTYNKYKYEENWIKFLQTF